MSVEKAINDKHVVITVPEPSILRGRNTFDRENENEFEESMIQEMLLSIGIPNENIHHQKYEHNQQYMEWVKNVKADIALAIFTGGLDSRYFRTGGLFDQVRQQKNNIKIILIGDKKYENYQSHKTKKRNMIDTYIYTPYEPEQLKKIILESLQETPASETNASSSASDNRLNIRA